MKSSGKLPHVICHMLCSVDGRTLSSHWKSPASGEIFESSVATIPADGWIVGRRTMQEFSSKKPRRRRKGRFSVPKTDFVAPHAQKTYAVAIDPSGKCNWTANHVDTEHVVEVLTEKVSAEYLDHLRNAGVSYIFGGKSALNLRQVLEKLKKLFGIGRITLQGGGTNNGSFLNAGLVNELSLIVAPFADGEKGTQSVFDIDPADKRTSAAKLSLISVERYREHHVWLKYKVTG